MRSRTFRQSARVILLDEEGRVFLFRVVDRLGNKAPLWVTHGGGVENDETIAQAASRELSEETGLVVRTTLLGEPVAVTRGEWEFRGLPLFSEDWYYVLRTEAFEPNSARWTRLEHELHSGWKWWPANELRDTTEIVLPARLAELAHFFHIGRRQERAIELPWLAL